MPAIDFTLSDLAGLMENFGSHAEHEGHLEELEQLDLSTDQDAQHAIRQWLLPAYQADWGRTATGRDRMKASLRVVMSRWGFLPIGPTLPGIDDDASAGRDLQETYALMRGFYRVLWDELYHAPLDRIAETDALRERVDISFVGAPGLPQRWGLPQYRSLTYWDDLLGTRDWRRDLPATGSVNPVATETQGDGVTAKPLRDPGNDMLDGLLRAPGAEAKTSSSGSFKQKARSKR